MPVEPEELVVPERRPEELFDGDGRPDRKALQTVTRGDFGVQGAFFRGLLD